MDTKTCPILLPIVPYRSVGLSGGGGPGLGWLPGQLDQEANLYYWSPRKIGDLVFIAVGYLLYIHTYIELHVEREIR